jgi:murein DD-endopeptidase MepM/ murein hydrolase activator NlpD
VLAIALLGFAPGADVSAAAPVPAQGQRSIVSPEPAPAPGPGPVPGGAGAGLAIAGALPRSDEGGWSWPIGGGIRVTASFLAPPHAYGAGHRGIDLLPLGSDTAIRAPADGVIAFVGTVVDRPLLTIDHGDGLVTTLEPVHSPLVAGTPVLRGGAVGMLASGGHALPGQVHFGVRRHGDYINPLLLLGGVPRAILLPCCADDIPG